MEVTMTLRREVSPSLPSPMVTIATGLGSPYPFWEHFMLMRTPFCFCSPKLLLNPGHCGFLTQEKLPRDLTYVSLLIHPLFWPLAWANRRALSFWLISEIFLITQATTKGRLFRRVPLSRWPSSQNFHLPGWLWVTPAAGSPCSGPLAFQPLPYQVIASCVLQIGTSSLHPTIECFEECERVLPLPNLEIYRSNVNWPGFNTLVRNFILWHRTRLQWVPIENSSKTLFALLCWLKAQPPGLWSRGHNGLSAWFLVQVRSYEAPGQRVFFFSSL